MKFTDLFVRRPVLAIVVNLVILIAGLQAIRSLSVRQYPRSDIAVVTVTTAYVGANAELVRGFISSVMLEAKEIGARMGIHIDQQAEDRHAVTLKLGAFKTSMLQDVEAGKAVELDALVTAVKELGELTAVPTPFTDALLGLARLHARVRGLY